MYANVLKYVCVFCVYVYVCMYTHTYIHIYILKLRTGNYIHVFEPNGIITCSFPSNIEAKNVITNSPQSIIQGYTLMVFSDISIPSKFQLPGKTNVTPLTSFEWKPCVK